jgi:hypothetical protein
MPDTFQISTYAAGVVGVSEPTEPVEDSDTTEEQE